MGLILSIDYLMDYGIYNAYLDELERESVETIYEKVMMDEFCGRHQMEAICRLICNKATIAKPFLANKYGALAKRLENEVEGGTNHFPDVLQDIVRSMVINSINEAGLLQDQKRQKIGKNIASFLGILFNQNLVDCKLLNELVQFAMKNKNRFEPFLYLLYTTVEDKLMMLEFANFDELNEHCTSSNSNGNGYK